MGTVYFAEQLRPVRRQVALKLIKRGMDSRDVLARFESERQPRRSFPATMPRGRSATSWTSRPTPGRSP